MKRIALFLAVLFLVLGLTTLCEARMTKESPGTVVRAAAVLTDSYVASSTVNMLGYTDACVYISFTPGSLTSMEFQFEGSYDGTNWFPETVGALSTSRYLDTAADHQVTVAGSYTYVVKDCLHNYLRVKVKGTGTVAGSSCTILISRVARF